MARTPSNMLPLGTQAVDFELPDFNLGGNFSLYSNKGKVGTLIMFICNHCPFVKHLNHELAQLAKDYQSQGIQVVAINSNDVENYPEDAPELMTLNAKENDFIFPYLFDESQEVAKMYDAACTPDFYLFNEDLKLVYRGQLDDSRPGNEIPVTGKDLREAMDSLLQNRLPAENQKPSIGCNIKWKV